jgi:hypothetical protein
LHDVLAHKSRPDGCRELGNEGDLRAQTGKIASFSHVNRMTLGAICARWVASWPAGPLALWSLMCARAREGDCFSYESRLSSSRALFARTREGGLLWGFLRAF